MKRILFIFVLSFSLNLIAQGQYSIKENILYYGETEDNYVKERCTLDLYYPRDQKNFPTIVWFHGGGLKRGNKNIAERLKNQGIAIVSANYRFYPEVNTRQVITDAAAAVAWTFKSIEKYGGDKNLIFVSGHSAGGYLTSMIGLDKSWLNKFEIDANKIAGLIPFSGHTITHFTVREEMGIAESQPIIDEMAPLFHVRDDAPPFIMITGNRELELLGRYEENAYMMRMMKVAGHKKTQLLELDGYGHGMAEPANPLLVKFVKEITANIINK